MSRSSRSDPEEAPQPHYLKGGSTVWSPPSVVVLDSETRTLDVGETEILGLRLWVAKHTDRRSIRKGQGPVTWGRGTTPADLGDWLVSRCRGRRTVWVYAHNLAFDLCTTGLPVVMGDRGWRVTDFSVRSTAPWLRLGDGRTVLTVCDSWSWLPEALGAVAGRYGAAKEPLPPEEGTEEEWWARCTTDVDLLDRALLDLMDWWDRHQLGRWSISGPSSGWSAWKNRPTPYRILVDPRPEVLAHDRLAIRGGRRDVQRVGDLGDGDWVEVDFHQAYATVAAHLTLPRARGATFDRLPLDHRAVDSEGWGMVAEVEVRTETPRYPMTWGGVTWYPVGHFRTVLCSPEIAWARANEDLVSIGPGRFHRLDPILEDWGRWVLDVASGLEPDSPPVAAVAAKAWGRAVVGKFASRTQSMEKWGAMEGEGWFYQDGWDHEAGCRGAVVSMAGQRWFATYDLEGENTYPAVLAWVESHVRARLGRLLDWLPEGVWVQADTDGAILDLTDGARLVRKGLDLTGRTRDAWGVAAQLCHLAQPLTWPLVPRPKRQHRSLRILGAQHLITDVDRRLAGVRRDAVEGEPWRFTVREWPKLRWQMAHGRPGEYHRPQKHPHVKRPTAHRWITEEGETWPVVAALDKSGQSILLPWASTWGTTVRTPLLPLQYKGLDRLH